MKILVIRYRFIGDTVLTVPFLRNLRRAYPYAQIDMLVGPVSGDVLLGCPYIDNLIYFDTTRKHKYENAKEPQKRKTFFSYIKLLRANKYDKAYVLKRSFSSAALAFFAGIKERIGFDTENRGFFLTKKLPYAKDRHEVECFLDVLRADNILVTDNYLENWIFQESEAKINSILEKTGTSNTRKVLIHATSGNVKKQWDKDNFAQIVEYLTNEKGFQVFFTGVQSDAQVYEDILSFVKKDLKYTPVNLCGKLSIQESTALIARMEFVVGSDSGTLHIAASLNIPVIGIYGPMNPNKWRAWGEIHKPVLLSLPCIPCDLSGECPRNTACIKDITPEMVIGKINELLD